MATTQQVRQSQLFAAEDWRVIYTAFTQVNFNAYDFNTIRSSMIDYVRINYPEDFNDWIESSEFVALIDLLAYLGQSLAFRMDLNTRENFLDTAQRRESIFRLARMLSYQPQRSIPASGLLKITAVITNQPVYDSYGNNLQNVQVIWNDQNNPDWFEQFILVINATLNSTNTFGDPAKSGTVNGIETQLYEMNNTAIPTSVVPFTATVAGNTVNMELANASFNEGSQINLANSGNFYEVDPDPSKSWNVIYRTDGNGYSSANTGFFLYFKQGSMQFKDYQCALPVPNRVIDVNADGVNQTDVWVQNIDTSGRVNKKWTKVPSVNGFNVIYNSLEKSIRDIYSVISRDNNGNDQISIRFADGNFGSVPIGIIRVWYRISNNLTYQIRPSDISNQTFAFGYSDNLNNFWNVAFTTNLQYTVNNAQSTESNARIAQNAPQIYYTQDRMVNGEDYNLFPLQDGRILKNKAVNRTYSGQSRYLDMEDPTGSYSDLNVFGTDGILYSENDLNMRDVVNSPGTNTMVVVNTQIQPLLNGSLGSQQQALELKNFFYYNYPRVAIPTGYTWNTITSLTKSCTGAFFSGSKAVQVGSSVPAANPLRYITQGSLVAFSNGKEASMVGIVGDGAGVNLTGKLNNGQGAITASTILSTGDVPVSVISAFRTTLTSTDPNNETSAVASALASHKAFGMRYDTVDCVWKIITADNLSSSDTFSLEFAGNTSSTNKDASWLVKVIWVGTGWRIYSRSLRYIFESVRQTRFYFENTKKIYDPATSTAQLDYISVLAINADPRSGTLDVVAPIIYANSYTIGVSSTVGITKGQRIVGPGIPSDTTVVDVGTGAITISKQTTSGSVDAVLMLYPPSSLGRDYLWEITGQQIYPDGYSDPRSVRLTMWEGENYGIPDDPDEYNEIVDPSDDPSKMLFWGRLTSSDGYQYWQPIIILQSRIYSTPALVPSPTSPDWVEGELVYVISTGVFYQYVSDDLIDVTADHKMRIGRKDISYLWKHYAPTDQRVNPAVMNVIDMYVLTSAYDTDVRNWIATNGSTDAMPIPPTSAELKSEFSNLEDYKQMTDQIVWHPVSYKVLFGSQAVQEYQAKFKVVKTPGTTITDNEVKSLVIQAVNQYFSLSNWDFGQSFFFTELAAYIHQQLATIVGSVVITPLNAQAKFGDLFEITCEADQIFISGARVTDVQIVPALTETTLGITNG
jgi:hypothetical protein